MIFRVPGYIFVNVELFGYTFGNVIMRRMILVVLAASIFIAFVPARVEAIDPVTIALAIQAAKIAYPYVRQGLINMGKHFIHIGGDLLELLLLPWGLIEMTLGAPLGGFSPGVKHSVKGGIAIGKLVWHCLLIPISPMGI